jgi:ferredoxin-NADP reductase
VPNFSILKDALRSRPKLRHTFLYSNKTWEDIIFRKELAELESGHPGRLTVVHMLTRESDASRFGPRIKKGRISADILREHVPEPSNCVAYVCGPAVSSHDRAAARANGTEPQPRFFESTMAALQQVGVNKEAIEHETYG